MLAVIAVVILVILIVDLILYRNELAFQGIMLSYAVRYLTEHPTNFLYLLFFFLMIFGMFVLTIFQHICFSNIRHTDNSIFNFANPGVLGILNII